jgi:two-component system response regulator FixJ
MHRRSVVFIIANDAAAQRDLAARVESLGIPHKTCRTAEEFLEAELPPGPACALADFPRRAEGDLQWLQRLAHRAAALPIVVIAAHADVPTAVAAMKQGSFDFLEAKCLEERFAATILAALRWDGEHRRAIARAANARRRLLRLTPGQREVLARLLLGKSNRQIAAELKLSVRSIEVRRAKIMKTMRAGSLAQLVRLAMLGGNEKGLGIGD